MAKAKCKDIQKDYTRKYSIVVNKEDLNLDIYCLDSSNSLMWLLKDLSENKKKSIYLIGKTLLGIFPEMIQYNFSKAAIDGLVPMFYFYKNEIDIEYFTSKLYACIRDIYANIKMPETEKITITKHLSEILNLNGLYKITNEIDDSVIEKAIKYNIYSLISSKKFEIGIEEIKRLYPSENLVMKHYEDRLSSNDFRIIDFMIGNNGSDLMCISTPIKFNEFYTSYVINLDVQPYGDNNYEVFCSTSIRRWVNEDSIDFEFDGEKSICFSVENMNKVLIVKFKNEESKDKKYKYSLPDMVNKVIGEVANKNFYDVISNPSAYMKEEKGFAGMPISADIVGSLTKNKYRTNTGVGNVDEMFVFDKVCEILDDFKFKFEKAANMQILVSGDVGVVKNEILDVRYAHIDEEMKSITVFYYYKDTELKDVFIKTLKETKCKTKDNIFELISEDGNKYIFNNKLKDKDIKFKVVCIETEIFQELLPKVDSQTILCELSECEDVKSLVADTRKRNATHFVNKCRDFILDNVDDFVDDDDEMIVNIVDIPSYHERGYTYRDPYKYVKEAFIKEGYHVQVRNMTEYNSKINANIVGSFKSSVGDIFTKLGVYVNFTNKEKAFKALNSINKDYIVGVNYMNIDGIDIAAAIKIDDSGLKIKIPKIDITNDKIVLVGSTPWEPIYNGVKKINALLKDIKLFKGKRYLLKRNASEMNTEFIKRISVDSRAIYMFRNVTLKSIKDQLNDICYVALRDEVDTKHGTFKKDKNGGYNLTASCMVAKDLDAKNSYISVSGRPRTLQGAPAISSFFIQKDYDARRAKALLFNVYGIEDVDTVASIVHETRKMCFSYDASTALPHPLHLISILGEEAGKAKDDI